MRCLSNASSRAYDNSLWRSHLPVFVAVSHATYPRVIWSAMINENTQIIERRRTYLWERVVGQASVKNSIRDLVTRRAKSSLISFWKFRRNFLGQVRLTQSCRDGPHQQIQTWIEKCLREHESRWLRLSSWPLWREDGYENAMRWNLQEKEQAALKRWSGKRQRNLFIWTVLIQSDWKEIKGRR